MELRFLLFTPLVIPLVMFISSGLNAKADLTSPEGLFPRYFFVLPAATHRIVQPFMLYAALFAAAQWSATELTALTPVAVVLLTLSATGSIIWVVLTGRSRSVLPWTFCAICGLCLLAPHIRQEQADSCCTSSFQRLPS